MHSTAGGKAQAGCIYMHGTTCQNSWATIVGQNCRNVVATTTALYVNTTFAKIAESQPSMLLLFEQQHRSIPDLTLEAAKKEYKSRSKNTR